MPRFTGFPPPELIPGLAADDTKSWSKLSTMPGTAEYIAQQNRISKISENTGAYKKGFIEAELDIKDSLWFFECHFKDDSVMPGCLGLDAMWQLVGFYLGWLGNPGKGRALGVNAVKFTGEVLKNVKKATYEIDMKRIIVKEGATVGLANGTLKADGIKIYSAENLKVGLFK
jgi:3-hydroxyacyl-[acyl-carrier protein] dehydratase/trans-2-decenoyl-[acyl-carrier protein] isomerase